MIDDVNNFIAPLFPFYFNIDAENRVVSTGKSLIKLFPEIAGRQLFENFIFIKPSVQLYDFNVIKHLENTFILIQSSHEPILTLRGEIRYNPSNNTIYFLVSPWIVDLNELKKIRLKVNDFALSDPILEFINLSTLYNINLIDNLELTNKLKRRNEFIEREKSEYDNVINSLDQVIFRTDTEGNWTFLNKAWEKIMNFSVKESLNTQFFGYVHPDDVQNNIDLFTPLMKREKNYCSHHTRYITKDKKVKWIRVYAVLILNKSNEIEGATGTLLDITNEMVYENKLELILNNMKEEISLTDIDGNFEFVSPSIPKNRGYTEDEFNKTTVHQNIHPEDIMNIRAQINNGIEKSEGEYRVKMKSGEYRRYYGNSKVITDPTTNKSYLLTVSRDVEDIKKLENHLTLITENISEEISMFDFDGQYIYASSSVIKNRGYSSFDEMKNINAFSIINPDQNEYLISELKKTGECIFERQFINLKGESVWYESHAKLITDKLTYKEYIVSVARNITERKQAQLQIEKALNKEKVLNKMKTTFITTSSHEFKTPLAIIKNSADIMSHKLGIVENEEAKTTFSKFIAVIHSETNNLLKLMNDTLLLERSQNNKLELNKKAFNPFIVLLETVERINLLQPDQRKTHINVKNKHKNMMADKALLSIVFENLLSNAFKYSIGKNNPEIYLEFQKNTLELTIKDYGIGIPSKDTNNLFIPFTRASNTDGIAGTGMGLSIVKRILELHNAEIDINSTQNVGTVVTTRIPYIS